MDVKSYLPFALMAIRPGALKHIVPWCRGCTGDFDSLSSGSIPDGTTTTFNRESFSENLK